MWQSILHNASLIDPTFGRALDYESYISFEPALVISSLKATSPDFNAFKLRAIKSSRFFKSVSTYLGSQPVML